MRPENKDELMEELGLKLTIHQTKMKNQKLFEEKHYRAFKAKNSNKFNKGAKFKKPEENDELRIEDLEFLQQIKTGQLDKLDENSLKLYEANRKTELPGSSNLKDGTNRAESVDLMTIKDGIKKFEKHEINRDKVFDMETIGGGETTVFADDDQSLNNDSNKLDRSFGNHQDIIEKKLKVVGGGSVVLGKENHDDENNENDDDLNLEEFARKHMAREAEFQQENNQNIVNSSQEVEEDYKNKGKSSSKRRKQALTMEEKVLKKAKNNASVYTSEPAHTQISVEDKQHIIKKFIESSQIDMSDNIFLSSQNIELLKKQRAKERENAQEQEQEEEEELDLDDLE